MASADNPTRVEIADDAAALAPTYADWLCQRIADSTAPFRMALCGGSTPQLLYRLLGSADYRSRIDWRKLEIFWGDERFVPPNDPNSNQRMARDLWLDHTPLMQAQIHPMPTDGTLDDCAARYEALLQARYGQTAFDRRARSSMWCCWVWARTDIPRR